MKVSTVQTYWYLNGYYFDWQKVTLLKQVLVQFTNIQSWHFYVRISHSQTIFHNDPTLKSNSVRVHIFLVSAFDNFKWGNFGNIMPYKVIFWRGYKHAHQYLNKVILTGWLSLWSSNTRIFLFVISSCEIIRASSLTNVAYF